MAYHQWFWEFSPSLKLEVKLLGPSQGGLLVPVLGWESHHAITVPWSLSGNLAHVLSVANLGSRFWATVLRNCSGWDAGFVEFIVSDMKQPVLLLSRHLGEASFQVQAAGLSSVWRSIPTSSRASKWAASHTVHLAILSIWSFFVFWVFFCILSARALENFSLLDARMLNVTGSSPPPPQLGRLAS